MLLWWYFDRSALLLLLLWSCCDEVFRILVPNLFYFDLGYIFRDLCKHLVNDVSHPWFALFTSPWDMHVFHQFCVSGFHGPRTGGGMRGNEEAWLWRRYLSSRADDVNAFGYFSFPPYCHVRGDDVFVCEDVTNWIVSLHWTDKQFAKVVRTHTQLLPLAKNHHKNSQMVFDGRELQLAIQETNLHFKTVLKLHFMINLGKKGWESPSSHGSSFLTLPYKPHKRFLLFWLGVCHGVVAVC